MDSLASNLRRPRHLLATFVIFLVLGGAGGAMVSLAAADAEAPPPVALPMPRVGDAGLYRLHTAPLDEDGRYRGFVEDRELEIRFQWGAPSIQYDEWGGGHHTYHLDLRQVDERGSRNATLFVDPATGQIATTYEEHHQPGEPGEGSGFLFPTNTTSQTTWIHTQFSRAQALPCGLISPFQGQPVAVGGWERDEQTCQWGPGDHSSNAHWQRVRGVTEDSDGLLVVDFVNTHPSDLPMFNGRVDWRSWYARDVAYPVRMTDLSGGHFGAPGDVLELEGFTQGSEPLVLPPTAPPDLPPLVQKPRTPWLIDDSDSQSPWPLSEAYDYALNDPTERGLSDFIGSHPDAYMAHAGHAAFDMDGRHTERWSFTMTDGTDLYGVSLAQDTTSDETLLGLTVEEGGVTYRYEDPWTAPVEDRILPPPELVPATMPTAASLLVQWRMVMAGTGNEDATDAWGFRVSCAETCDELHVQVNAGQTYYYRESAPGYPLMDNRIDAWDTAELSWFNGRLSSATQSFQLHTTQTNTPLLDDPDQDPVSSEEHELPPLQAAWAWPDPAEVAAVGAAAFFGALLYYLWPLLKAGGAGLFTRLREDDLLNHPERRAIHEVVTAEPGLHQNELRRRVGLGNGSLSHHLQLLERARLITSARASGYTCYYVTGQVDRHVMQALPALRSDGAKRIFAAVTASPGIPGAEAARAAGLTPQTGHHHIQRLVRAGLLSSVRDGRVTRLRPTDLAQRLPASAAP